MIDVRFRGLKSLLAAGLVLAAGDALAEKIKIEKLDDLPRHTYEIDKPAAEVLMDDDAMGALTAAVEADLLSDLDLYEIEDKTTLKDYYDALGLIAFLEGRYPDYEKWLGMALELEDKEALRLTRGLFPRSWIVASQDVEKPFDEALREALERRVNALPYEIVEATIKQQKGMSEIISEPLMIGVVESQVQPQVDKSDGELTKELAMSLINNSVAVRFFIPHKAIVAEVFAAYLDAHAVEKADIWAARSVDLTNHDGLQEVVIGVWDSGVDMEIFASLDQAWTNPGEVPGNGIDDDGNGFVDDVHGIAYDLEADKIVEQLYPIEDVEDRALLQRRMKGLRDVQMNIDSEEASDLKKTMSAMEQTQVKPFIESISAYGNHSHGTHVAGISSDGNPAARILTARLTFSHEIIPPKPTLEQAKKDAQMMRETVRYFQENDVRVVNMSWGAGIADIEAALAAHNEPPSTEERKELARQIFEIMKGALEEAMAQAPEIAFCIAAGNSNNDNVFEEFIPSSIDLPNVITVGAVDEAGDETSFTTFGKVDVYANGFNVLSYVPGGEKMKLSGTSMASPNAANLVGKLFALDPSLDPVRVKEILVSTAETRQAGDRTVRLLHPQTAVAAVEEGLQGSR